MQKDARFPSGPAGCRLAPLRQKRLHGHRQETEQARGDAGFIALPQDAEQNHAKADGCERKRVAGVR